MDQNVINQQILIQQQLLREQLVSARRPGSSSRLDKDWERVQAESGDVDTYEELADSLCVSNGNRWAYRSEYDANPFNDERC